jgi:acyl carrier protein
MSLTSSAAAEDITDSGIRMDSLDLVEYQMAIEDRFKLSISDERLEGLRTIEDAVEIVLEAAAARVT